jgi:methanogenic corrinoid protein MtbC1
MDQEVDPVGEYAQHSAGIACSRNGTAWHVGFEGTPMLKWCSYCQQFMGEIPPYDDFGMTHGLCTKCNVEHFDIFDGRGLDRALFLSDIFQRLFDAGRREDFPMAARVVEQAISANCRPVDILIGMIAPMLYEIGEEWKRGELSIASEHRFTAFSERVVDLIGDKIETRVNGEMRAPPTRAAEFLLMNAPGNRHTVAIRILALWLESRGLRARIIDGETGFDGLMHELAAVGPKYFLISMSLVEQRDGVVAVVRRIQTLPAAVRPRVVVGGYPVKAGLVQSIPAADLIADINALCLN